MASLCQEMASSCRELAADLLSSWEQFKVQQAAATSSPSTTTPPFTTPGRSSSSPLSRPRRAPSVAEQQVLLPLSSASHGRRGRAPTMASSAARRCRPAPRPPRARPPPPATTTARAPRSSSDLSCHACRRATPRRAAAPSPPSWRPPPRRWPAPASPQQAPPRSAPAPPSAAACLLRSSALPRQPALRPAYARHLFDVMAARGLTRPTSSHTHTGNHWLISSGRRPPWPPPQLCCCRFELIIMVKKTAERSYGGMSAYTPGSEFSENKPRQNFRLGDITWVKHDGSSWWPVQVIDAAYVSSKPKKKTSFDALVRLYGTSQYLYADPWKSNREFEMILKEENKTAMEAFHEVLQKELSHFNSPSDYDEEAVTTKAKTSAKKVRKQEGLKQSGHGGVKGLATTEGRGDKRERQYSSERDQEFAPCIQCIISASDENCWFYSWLVLCLFSSLEVLVGSYITGPLVLNKLMGLVARHMDHWNSGQGIKYVELTRDNTYRQSVPSVLAQLKCDGPEHHLDQILNTQIWALQVTHHLAKVGWQNLLLQHHVGGLSPWDPGGVRFVNILGVVVKLQVPWDPGVLLVLGGVGLRSSRFSRGGECHDPGHRDASGPSHDMGWAGTGLGLAGAVDELYKGSGAEEKGIEK